MPDDFNDRYANKIFGVVESPDFSKAIMFRKIRSEEPQLVSLAA